MEKLLLSFVLLLTVGSVFGFWGSCPTGGPAPISVVAPANCDSNHCTVYRTQSLVAQLRFRAPNSASYLGVSFTAWMLNGQFPIDLSVDDEMIDACVGQVAPSCPLVAGQEYVWNINFSIGEEMPTFEDVPIDRKISQQVYDKNYKCFISVQLSDIDGNVVVCTRVRATIK